MATFSERLTAVRTARGVSQAELARRSGLSTQGINAIERGKRPTPSIDTVCALAQALDLTDAECGQLVCPTLRRAA